MPDDAQVDPRRTIEKLRRELDARTTERDEALAERMASWWFISRMWSIPRLTAPGLLRAGNLWS